MPGAARPGRNVHPEPGRAGGHSADCSTSAPTPSQSPTNSRCSPARTLDYDLSHPSDRCGRGGQACVRDPPRKMSFRAPVWLDQGLQDENDALQRPLLLIPFAEWAGDVSIAIFPVKSGALYHLSYRPSITLYPAQARRYPAS